MQSRCWLLVLLSACRSEVTIAPAQASGISFARMAQWPEPGWQVPRNIAFAPDGNSLTYLQSEAHDDNAALWRFDWHTAQAQVLLRAADVLPEPAQLSRDAERAYCGSSCHAPPRKVRTCPAAGPCGSFLSATL